MFRKPLINKNKRDFITVDYAHNYRPPKRKAPWRILITIIKWGGIVAMFTLSALYVNKLQAAEINPINKYTQFSTLADVTGGQLLFESTERVKTNQGEKKLYQPALVVNSTADFDINGIIATVTLTQSFLNNGDTIAHGLYAFPLPEHSAVNYLKIQVGNRTVEGKITEKQEAKRLFKQAQQQGKKASLVEQHRPNLFTNKIANIGPKEQITVTITYVQHVDYDKGEFSLRFPMTITPRYSPIATIDVSNKHTSIENNINANSINTNKLNTHDNHLVSYLSTIAASQVNNIQLAVNLNAGVDLNAITSPSHLLTTTQSSQNEQQYQVSVGNVHVPMDKDFVLQWRPTPKSTPQLSIVHQLLNNETYAVAMLIPPTLDNNQTFPRDVTFIIDTSGSMQGSSIKQAKQSLLFALNTLSPRDSFNIIAFESTTQNLFNTTLMATPDNINKAKNFISKLSADGGTEMIQPLKNALSMQQTTLQDTDAIKQILFITDGAVSNEKALFQLISNTTELPRIFTVGIGSAPNGYFMRKAAQFGQGSYTYIGNVNNVEEKMSNLLSKISKPALKNIQVKFHPLHIGSLEQYPNKIPDLYADEPLVVAFKTTVMPTSIQLFGELTNQPWQQKVELASQDYNNDDNTRNKLPITSHKNGITSIWARAKIEDLLDSVITGKPINVIKPLVIKTSINHQVMSPFTSFLAIETENVETLELASADSEAKQATRLHKAQRTKKSTSIAMVATPFPKTAVGWVGQLFIGLLILMISLISFIYTTRSHSTITRTEANNNDD